MEIANYYIMSMEKYNLLKNEISEWYKNTTIKNKNYNFIIPPHIISIKNEGFQLNQTLYPNYLLTRHQQIDITSFLLEENRIIKKQILNN
jgi:hypothetical protein